MNMGDDWVPPDDVDGRIWIKHEGKTRPVHRDHTVWIRFRNGYTEKEPVVSSKWKWEWPADSDYAFDIRWFARIKQ